jgi:hypothetical protein
VEPRVRPERVPLFCAIIEEPKFAIKEFLPAATVNAIVPVVQDRRGITVALFGARPVSALAISFIIQ